MLWIALAGSAVVIAARALAGPLTWPVTVNFPINAESVFGLALVLGLLLRAEAVGAGAEIGRRALNGRDALALTTIALLAAGVFARSADLYFLSDDFVLLKHAKTFWTAFPGIFVTPGGDGFYRPLTYLSMALSAPWADSNPTAWHAIGILIHAANSILVFLLARVLGLSRLPAWFAAVLFAVHGTRPEAVVWMAARADLLATFFTLTALGCFIRSWDAPGRGGGMYRCVALIAMMLAFLSKESSYTIPLLLVVYLAARGALRHRHGLRNRHGWIALAPFFVAAAAFFAWRWHLFGGVGGYVDASGRPEAFTWSALPVLKTLGLRLWGILFFPINWTSQPGLLLGLIMIAYLAAVAWLFTARPERRAVSVQLAFLLLLAVPPLQQLLIGAGLQKARLLYLPSVAFCLLLATALEAVKPKAQWVLAFTMVAFNIAAIFHNLSAWDKASQKARAACSVAAACTGGVAVVGLPASLNGVYFFANGFPECVELKRSGRSTAVDLRNSGEAVDRARYSCILSWDAGKDVLSPLPYDIH